MTEQQEVLFVLKATIKAKVALFAPGFRESHLHQSDRSCADPKVCVSLDAAKRAAADACSVSAS
jgi:hypothetical protein